MLLQPCRSEETIETSINIIFLVRNIYFVSGLARSELRNRRGTRVFRVLRRKRQHEALPAALRHFVVFQSRVLGQSRGFGIQPLHSEAATFLYPGGLPATCGKQMAPCTAFLVDEKESCDLQAPNFSSTALWK